VFVLRDKFGEALGDIGLRISPKNPHEADVGYALLPRLREKAMPAKRCGRSAIMVSARWGAGHQCLGAG
jgi:hypothetical protein